MDISKNAKAPKSFILRAFADFLNHLARRETINVKEEGLRQGRGITSLKGRDPRGGSQHKKNQQLPRRQSALAYHKNKSPFTSKLERAFCFCKLRAKLAKLLVFFVRRERDSNPWYLAVQRFSRPPHSTTLPSLLCWKVFSKVEVGEEPVLKTIRLLELLLLQLLLLLRLLELLQLLVLLLRLQLLLLLPISRLLVLLLLC